MIVKTKMIMIAPLVSNSSRLAMRTLEISASGQIFLLQLFHQHLSLPTLLSVLFLFAHDEQGRAYQEFSLQVLFRKCPYAKTERLTTASLRTDVLSNMSAAEILNSLVFSRVGYDGPAQRRGFDGHLNQIL